MWSFCRTLGNDPVGWQTSRTILQGQSLVLLITVVIWNTQIPGAKKVMNECAFATWEKEWRKIPRNEDCVCWCRLVQFLLYSEEIPFWNVYVGAPYCRLALFLGDNNETYAIFRIVILFTQLMAWYIIWLYLDQSCLFPLWWEGSLGCHVHLAFSTHLLLLSPCSRCSSHLGILPMVWTDQACFHPRSLVLSLSGALCPRSAGGRCSWAFFPLHTAPPHIPHSKLASSPSLPLSIIPP